MKLLAIFCHGNWELGNRKTVCKQRKEGGGYTERNQRGKRDRASGFLRFCSLFPIVTRLQPCLDSMGCPSTLANPPTFINAGLS